MIDEGSVLKYDKGTYTVLEGESVFDLHPSIPLNSQYCKNENVYFTPKGKLNKAQIEFLKNPQNKEKQDGFFKKIYNKFLEIKDKILGLFKH